VSISKKEAAGFYADLEKLPAGQADDRSRKARAAAYLRLADLTDTIGAKPEALAVHRHPLRRGYLFFLTDRVRSPWTERLPSRHTN
jgi:hypothetical protein